MRRLGASTTTRSVRVNIRVGSITKSNLPAHRLMIAIAKPTANRERVVEWDWVPTPRIRRALVMFLTDRMAVARLVRRIRKRRWKIPFCNTAPAQALTHSGRINAPVFSCYLYRFRNLVGRFFETNSSISEPSTRFENCDENYVQHVLTGMRGTSCCIQRPSKKIGVVASPPWEAMNS